MHILAIYKYDILYIYTKKTFDFFKCMGSWLMAIIGNKNKVVLGRYIHKAKTPVHVHGSPKIFVFLWEEHLLTSDSIS